jgi:hypothetical protein
VAKMAKLNELRKKVKDFEKQAGFDKTEAKELLTMLQKELDLLKANADDKNVADHQIMDIQILILQIANRLNTDMDSEWKTWFEKSKKYLKKEKNN